MSVICSGCGCELDNEEIYTMGDAVMCEECYDSNTRTCECCGERIWNEDDDGDDNIILCRHCRDNHYTTCEECGRLIHDDDAYYLDDDSDYPYCHTCYTRFKRKYIHSYSYKPTPVFHGDGKLFMGVELEIDGGGCDDNNAETLCEIASDSQIYIKTDGSLDEGLEIVTHPMTLEYHQQTMPWREITSKAVSLGYLSHRTNTCGLHVHVNRTAFGSDRTEQDVAISRILFFIERFWQEMLRFSRRTEYQINRWAARYGIKDNPKQVMDNAKSTGKGRYACINLCNYSTIEFRIFRGTLKYNTLIATLQMVDLICKTAVSLTDEEMTALSWPEFVMKITEPELIQYLKERRLYVNEPVTETEEY